MYWIAPAKLGISSQKQRKVLRQSVLKIAGLAGKVLLADREYMGSDWFKTLTENGLDFVIRLRNYQHAMQLAGIEESPQKSRCYFL